MSRRKRMLEELDRDILDHIEGEAQDNIERGMSPEEARYAALRKFGNVTLVKEDTRNVWSVVWLEQLLQGWCRLRESARCNHPSNCTEVATKQVCCAKIPYSFEV